MESTTSDPSAPNSIRNTPPKKSKHSGGGRKGSLMFTTSGSYGLGVTVNLNPTNVHLPQDQIGTGYNAQSQTVDHIEFNGSSSATTSNIISNQNGDAVTLNEIKSQPSFPQNAASSAGRGGRKGSMMFTNMAAMGRSSAQTESSNAIETTQPPMLASSGATSNGRKGSIMFGGSSAMMSTSVPNTD